MRRLTLAIAVASTMVWPLACTGSPLNERQVLAVFKEGTVTLPDSVVEADLSEAIVPESDLSVLMSTYGVTEIGRAFPDFDRADTVGVSFTGEQVRLTDWSKVWLLTLPDGGDQDAFIDALKGSAATVIAEPNGIGVSFAAPRYPNDANFKSGGQWGLWQPQSGTPSGYDTRATWAWGDTTGSPSIRIGIIDNGLTGDVPDLQGKVIVSDGTSVESNHAYRLAGVVGAATNNLIGISGVDWNARLVSLKGGGNFTDTTTIRALRTATDPLIYGARVINASWGLKEKDDSPRYNIYVEAAFKDVHARNGVSVCAMGNTGTNGYKYIPANLQHGVIAVGAINKYGQRWSKSSTGDSLDLVAPGVDILTTDSTGAYLPDSGTSYAAPFVAGAASLLFAANDSLNADDIEQLLKLSADPMGVVSEYGAGRVNIQRAIALMSPPNQFDSRTIHVPYSSLTRINDGIFDATVFAVPGLDNNNYLNIERWKISVPVTFSLLGLGPYSHVPTVWGRGGGQTITSGWIKYIGSIRLVTDWRYCFATNVTTTGCTINAYVYMIPNNQGTRHWFPAGEPTDQFSFSFSVLSAAQLPDPGRCYYVPETGSTTSPSDGLDSPPSFSFFRGCPDNDGASYPSNARVKVAIKDALGNGIAGFNPADVLVLFNGGTPVQGFVGDGADSVTASAEFNSIHHCPDLRALYADGPTDASGVTYITFHGPSSPSRDSARKWGHFDSNLGVYVGGSRVLGRLSDSSLPGSYVLQIKSLDFVGGTTLLHDQGELINSGEFNSLVSRIGQSYGTFWLDWWMDYNSDGVVDNTDLSQLLAHLNHYCDTPFNP